MVEGLWIEQYDVKHIYDIYRLNIILPRSIQLYI